MRKWRRRCRRWRRRRWRPQRCWDVFVLRRAFIRVVELVTQYDVASLATCCLLANCHEEFCRSPRLCCCFCRVLFYFVSWRVYSSRLCKEANGDNFGRPKVTQIWTRTWRFVFAVGLRTGVALHLMLRFSLVGLLLCIICMALGLRSTRRFMCIANFWIASTMIRCGVLEGEGFTE